MRRIVAAALAYAALAACSSTEPAKPPAAPQLEPGRVEPTAPPPPPPAPTADDQCGAKVLAHLVGRPKSEIPVPVDPALRRVVCSTCPVTMDFNPRRLNIFFDAETGVIKEVKCG